MNKCSIKERPLSNGGSTKVGTNLLKMFMLHQVRQEDLIATFPTSRVWNSCHVGNTVVIYCSNFINTKQKVRNTSHIAQYFIWEYNLFTLNGNLVFRKSDEQSNLTCAHEGFRC